MSTPAAERRRAGFRLIRETVRARRRHPLFALGAASVYTAVVLITPLVAGAVIDNVIVKGHSELLPEYIAVLLALGVLRAAAGATRKYQATKGPAHMSNDLRRRLYDHFQRLSFSFHDRVGAGQLMARTSTDVTAVEQVLNPLPWGIQSSAMFVFGVMFLLLVQPLLAGAVAVVVVIGIVIALRRAAALYPASLSVQERLGEWSEFVEQQVQGIRVVKGHGFEQQFQEGGAGIADKTRDAGISFAVARASFQAALIAGPGCAFIVVVGLGGWLGATGRITPGHLLAFLQYLAILVAPVAVGAEFLSKWPQASAAATRIAEVLAAEPDVSEAPHARGLRPGGGAVRYEHVTFGYRADRPVLTDLDIEIAAGSSVALVGASGAGKTTAAFLTCRFYDPDRGRVLLDGQPVNELRLSELRRAVSIVFEDTVVFTASIRENLRIGEPDASDRALQQRGRAGGGRRIHPRAPPRLRHGGRTAGLFALGRATPAPRDRPGDPARLPAAHPRRRHERGRSTHGGRDPPRAPPGDEGPHDPRDRAPDRDDQPRRPRGAPRRRPRHRRRHPRRAGRVAAVPARTRARRVGGRHRVTSPEQSPRVPIRRLIADFRPFARPGLIALTGVVLGVVCQVTMPLVVAVAINQGVVAQSTGTVAACVAVGLALVAGQVTGSYVELRWMGTFGERYLADLRGRLLAHLHDLDLDYFSHEPSGRVVSRLTSDVEALQEFMQQGLSLLLRGILLLVLTIIIMFTQSWQLTLAMLAVLPVLAVAGSWYRPRAYDVQMGYRESMAEMLNHVNEALVGMRVVQAYGNETPQRNAFTGVNRATYDARRMSGSVTARFYAVVELTNPIALAIIVGYGSVLANRNEITVGTVIAFTLFLTRLFEPIEQFTELTSLVQTAGAAFSRTFAFLGRAPALVDDPDALDFERGVGRIEIAGVTFRYADGAPPAVADADLVIAPGERIAVVGTSGAGKSTLAKLIGRFYDPSEGTIRIDGQDLRGVRSSSLRTARGGRAAGGLPLRRDDRRQHRARPPRRDTRRSGAGVPARSDSPTRSTGSPAASTRPSPTAGSRSRRVSGSSLRSPGRSSPIPP